MGNVINCQSTLCTYAQSGNWASSNTKSTIYIGTNSAGTYKYVGQWAMPGINASLGELKRVTMNIYRNSNNSNYDREYYIGCTSSSTDSASVLSTGVMFTLSAGEGWKSIDVSGLAEYISVYSSQWYLLIGNPNDKGTYAEIAGYGTGCMLYLTLEFSNGSVIYHAENGSLVPYKLYHAENGSLVEYQFSRAENGSLIKY